MTTTRFSIDPKKRTIPLIAMAALLLLAGIQHFVVLNIVFPAIDGLLLWDVPSRTGGTSNLLDPGEFATLSLTFMGVMGALFIISAILLRLNKATGAILFSSLFFSVALIFFMLSFGNILGELGNAWTSVGGVALAILITMAAQIWMIKSFKINGVSPK